MTDLNVDKLTPPSELVEQWRTAPEFTGENEIVTMVTMTMRRLREVAAQAAGWGADQELEACVQWVNSHCPLRYSGYSRELRAARRPKLPSLKEQALEALNRQERGRDRGSLRPQAMADADIIRRALEALPND